MLVLDRKPGQAIIINESVRLYVVRVRGKRVRVSIDAPSEIRVRREEAPPRDEGFFGGPCVPDDNPLVNPK